MGGGSVSSVASGAVARIGGIGGGITDPTHLTLIVDNDVTMTGGSIANAGAVIGSGFLGGGPTEISMSVGNNVTLNPGTVTDSGSNIGSPSVAVAGGDISVVAGGNIALNSAGPGLGSFIRTTGGVTLQANAITEDANAVIQAGQLSTTSNAGTSLVGPNQVAGFNATNSTSGNVALNNTSPLLTVTGINQTASGALTLNQTGNLAFTGNVNSGAQSLNATGDVTVAAGTSSLTLSAAGPQSITSGGTLNVQGGAADSVSAVITGTGPTNVTVGGNLSLLGGSGQDAHALLFSSGDINLTVGGVLTLNQGTGQNAWARIQTETRDSMINIFFPNLSSGGFFVNDIEGALRRGQTGLLSGNGVAVPDHTLIINYGE